MIDTDTGPDDHERCPWWRRRSVLLWMLILSPVGYVASVGPAVWLHDNGLFPDGLDDLLTVYYYPLLIWMFSDVPGAELIRDYIDWWESL